MEPIVEVPEAEAPGTGWRAEFSVWFGKNWHEKIAKGPTILVFIIAFALISFVYKGNLDTSNSLARESIARGVDLQNQVNNDTYEKALQDRVNCLSSVKSRDDIRDSFTDLINLIVEKDPSLTGEGNDVLAGILGTRPKIDPATCPAEPTPPTPVTVNVDG